MDVRRPVGDEVVRARAAVDDAALARGEARTWIQIADLLEDVDATRMWADWGARSFTAWLNEAAARWRVSPVLLWRYKAAARALPVISGALEALGHPPLKQRGDGDLPDPETLLLLSKLARVIEHDPFAALAHRTVDGMVRRAELRRMLADLKAATHSIVGEPAAGGALSFVARLHEAVRQPTLEWLGPDTRASMVLQGTALPRRLLGALGTEITLVTVTPTSTEAMFAYLHWSGPRQPAEHVSMQGLLPYYDSLWIVRRANWAPEPPSGFGVLALDGTSLTVLAPASAAPTTGTETGRTARCILATWG